MIKSSAHPRAWCRASRSQPDVAHRHWFATQLEVDLPKRRRLHCLDQSLTRSAPGQPPEFLRSDHYHLVSAVRSHVADEFAEFGFGILQQPAAKPAPEQEIVSSQTRSMKLLSARKHLNNHLHAFDLCLWTLCCLQPVGNRIQIGPIERREELPCLGVTSQLLHELGRHRCVGGGVVRSGPAPVGLGGFHFLETGIRHLTRLDEPIHVHDISLGPAAFGPSGE